MRLQYCSDLHYEFKPVAGIPKLLKDVKADVLILAGDICAISDPLDYSKFVTLISHYSKKYKFIIHVPGNHEFYCTIKPPKREHCMDTIAKQFKVLMKQISNYIYLDCDTISLNINDKQYLFAGCTLWTKIKPEDYIYVQKSMNDYSTIYIYDGKIEKFTVEYMQKLHNKCIAFIKRAIKKAEELKIPIVLITHHKPVADDPSPNRLTQAYEVDMTKIIKSPVVAAIHGHTHEHYDKVINGVRYISNPKGYPSQRTGFKEDMYIDVTNCE